MSLMSGCIKITLLPCLISAKLFATAWVITEQWIVGDLIVHYPYPAAFNFPLKSSLSQGHQILFLY